MCLGSQARVLSLPHPDHLSRGMDGTACLPGAQKLSGTRALGLGEGSLPDSSASGSVAQPWATFQETPGAPALS